MQRLSTRALEAAVVAFAVAACSSSSGGGAPSPSPGSPSGSGSGGGSSGGGGGGGGAGPALGASESGVATYYAADGSGNCSFDPSPGDLDVAAMDNGEYAGSAVCGECVAVKGPKGSVTVRIVDRCPECERGHLDLSKEAFAKIADVAQGRVPITWQVVPCAVQGDVTYHYKDGTSQYWTAIQVRNHKLPIAKLEIEKGGSFVAVNRESYNYFVLASGAGPGPVKVRITAASGQTLTDTLPAAASDVSATGAAQFE